MTNKAYRDRRFARIGATVAAGVALAAGAGMVAPTVTASHAQAVGVMDVISAGVTAYTQYSECRSNLETGLPCLQSTHETVNQIYTMVKEFRAQYDKDSARTRDTLDVVIKEQKDQAVAAAWESVRADFEVSHEGMAIYQAGLECLAKAPVYGETVKPGEPAPQCSDITQHGVKVGERPASLASYEHYQQMLIAKQHRNDDSEGGYELGPADLMKRVGGESTNPYKSTGLLHAVLDRELANQAHEVGLAPGKPVTVFPAATVNRIGELASSIVDLEKAYFAVRVAGQEMAGNDTYAKELVALADQGRADTSPILSLAAQQATYTFPGWSREKPLPADSGFLVFGGKALLIRNHGAASSVPQSGAIAASLPTKERISEMARAISDGGGYSANARAAGSMLPSASAVAGNAQAVGRWWSAPTGVSSSSVHQDDEKVYVRPRVPAVYVKMSLCRELTGACTNPTSYQYLDANASNKQSVPIQIFNVATAPSAGNDWDQPNAGAQLTAPVFDAYRTHSDSNRVWDGAWVGGTHWIVTPTNGANLFQSSVVTTESVTATGAASPQA